jgi:hypothetical protein
MFTGPVLVPTQSVAELASCPRRYLHGSRSSIGSTIEPRKNERPVCGPSHAT